jgi:alpha-N-arabinofuranosidase
LVIVVGGTVKSHEAALSIPEPFIFGFIKDWNEGKGDALKFDAVDWYELLRQGDVMESLINGHWLAMGEFDKNHSIKLVVDEWGPWYRPGSEATPGDILEQMPTLRDAVFSGLTLDTFNRHPEKVAMANCAQLINCLNSLYLAHEDKFCNPGRSRVRDVCRTPGRAGVANGFPRHR